MLVTVPGIVTFSSPEQPAKARLPMVLTPEPQLIVLSDVQL
jgi:hypothetical protein